MLLVETVQNVVWKFHKYAGYMLKVMELVSQGDICPDICTTALLLIAKKWEQPYPAKG